MVALGQTLHVDHRTLTSTFRMSKLTVISATIGPYKITITSRYLTNTAIREKLAPVKLNRYKDDILFYMFYTNVGDVLQMAAAAELYNRDWR